MSGDVNLEGYSHVVQAMGTVVGQPPHGGGHQPQEDDGALRHLYQSHAPVLLSYLLRLTNGDRHRAEDIVQETLLRAWKHPEAQSADGRWSRAWLFTVARRIAIDQVRAAQARPAETSDERMESFSRSDDEIDRLLDAREVRAALAALPERLRTALVAVYFQEYSIAEAAQALDVPPGTVKSRTFYALRALREQLIERGFTPGVRGREER
ncbi:sigma-70 family RNA polymerase sigma factor [Micromonospora sp. DT233]|uniref:sigma-70 family RNA polymerase sigma factor n=1 Tax=Micromonospora sp. DT233 TaxID=3393432 RepID=UPI003CF750E1